MRVMEIDTELLSEKVGMFTAYVKLDDEDYGADSVTNMKNYIKAITEFAEHARPAETFKEEITDDLI